MNMFVAEGQVFMNRFPQQQRQEKQERLICVHTLLHCLHGNC
jgi:hypothetical protein